MHLWGASFIGRGEILFNEGFCLARVWRCARHRASSNSKKRSWPDCAKGSAAAEIDMKGRRARLRAGLGGVCVGIVALFGFWVCPFS